MYSSYQPWSKVSTVLARKTAGDFYQISPNLQMAKLTVNVMSDTSQFETIIQLFNSQIWLNVPYKR